MSCLWLSICINSDKGKDVYLHKYTHKQLDLMCIFVYLKDNKLITQQGETMTAKEVIKLLKADGWFELKGKGSGHQQFKHPEKNGKVTVAVHGSRDLSIDELKSIEKQSGVKLRK